MYSILNNISIIKVIKRKKGFKGFIPLNYYEYFII